uniref:Gypsy retrotransposon integrase-like protein 1 n=1 Tax=Acanthochromis polyacanthus TaxID=80966 RepID=A0A3Q1EUJ0_9TELE
MPETGWKEAQWSDPDIKAIREYVTRSSFPSRAERLALPSRTQKLLRQWKKLMVRDDLLYRTAIDRVTYEEHHQVVCPSSRCEEVWRRIHEAGAHCGVERTLARIRQQFYWPNMEGEVRAFQEKCVRCCLQKSRVEPKAPLHPIESTYPLEIIELDYLTLGRPTDTYQNILVATDKFTRFAWAIPTIDQTAQTTVKMLWKHIMQPFGCPSRYHSDRGPNFESALMQQLCDLYGIAKSRTTSYHAAGNGGVERFNQTLLNMLRTLDEEKQRSWQSYLLELVHAYNNTVHSVTGYAPSFLMFGRHLRLPVDVGLGLSFQQQSFDLNGWVKDHQSRLSFAYGIARGKIAGAASQHKRQFDKKAKALPLVPGERVLLRNRRREGKGKLSTWWDPEPHVILDCVGETGVVYKVRPEKGGREQTVHRNNLKLCIASPTTLEPPVGELSLPTQRIELPVFYGFMPAAPELDDSLELPRRSTRVNLGQQPARYRD